MSNKLIEGLISPYGIKKHLQTFLPRLTDDFNDSVSVSGEIIDGTSQILRVTEANHGKSTGNTVTLINVLINNPITAVSQSTEPDGTKILRFTVENDHDLTFEYEGNTIELNGFTDSQFNVTFDLYGVPNRTTFEIVKDDIPVLNGNEVLTEFWENGIDGNWSIENVTTNNYDIQLTDKPFFTPGILPKIERVTKWRISVTADINRANSIYTPQEQDKLWLFIIMGDMAASKDRNVVSDATAENNQQTAGRLLNINTFTLVVFIPTSKNDLAAARASQKAWTELNILLRSSMTGVKFEDFDDTNYQVTMIGHGSTLYNNAYYGHGYDFEYSYNITNATSFIEKFIESRAFRDDGIDFNELSQGSNIDLDG